MLTAFAIFRCYSVRLFYIYTQWGLICTHIWLNCVVRIHRVSDCRLVDSVFCRPLKKHCVCLCALYGEKLKHKMTNCCVYRLKTLISISKHTNTHTHTQQTKQNSNLQRIIDVLSLWNGGKIVTPRTQFTKDHNDKRVMRNKQTRTAYTC